MIKLEFSIDEVNQIMAALGNMPYVQVAALVDKIKSDRKSTRLNSSHAITSRMPSSA